MGKFGNKNRDDSDLVTEKIETELFINDNELNSELMDQPLLYRKYGKLKSIAHKNMKAIDIKLDTMMAAARLEFKKAHQKATVADIDALITLDPRIQQLKQELLDSEEMHEDLENILYALRQRHENIKELCANFRKEMAD